MGLVLEALANSGVYENQASLHHAMYTRSNAPNETTFDLVLESYLLDGSAKCPICVTLSIPMKFSLPAVLGFVVL